jgi:hypothetical protein
MSVDDNWTVAVKVQPADDCGGHHAVEYASTATVIGLKDPCKPARRFLFAAAIAVVVALAAVLLTLLAGLCLALWCWCCFSSFVGNMLSPICFFIVGFVRAETSPSL